MDQCLTSEQNYFDDFNINSFLQQEDEDIQFSEMRKSFVDESSLLRNGLSVDSLDKNELKEQFDNDRLLLNDFLTNDSTILFALTFFDLANIFSSFCCHFYLFPCHITKEAKNSGCYRFLICSMKENCLFLSFISLLFASCLTHLICHKFFWFVYCPFKRKLSQQRHSCAIGHSHLCIQSFRFWCIEETSCWKEEENNDVVCRRPDKAQGHILKTQIRDHEKGVRSRDADGSGRFARSRQWKRYHSFPLHIPTSLCFPFWVKSFLSFSLVIKCLFFSSLHMQSFAP